MKIAKWTFVATVLVAASLTVGFAATNYGAEIVKGFTTSSLVKH